jgi:hypothetical protein
MVGNLPQIKQPIKKVNQMSAKKKEALRRLIKDHQKKRILAFFVPPALLADVDEKVYNELHAEAFRDEKPANQYGALKHGGYSKELILPGEDPEEFESSYQELIAEYKPNGASEKEAILTLALNYWQKRRVNRWYCDEAAWLSEHAVIDEIQSFEWHLKFLDSADTIQYAHFVIRQFPERYLRVMLPELNKPKFSDEKKEIQRLQNLMLEFIALDEYKTDFEKDTLRFKAEAGRLLRELTENKIATEVRLDSQIDKTIKRFAQLKTLKQVIQMQALPAEIETHRRALPPEQK